MSFISRRDLLRGGLTCAAGLTAWARATRGASTSSATVDVRRFEMDLIPAPTDPEEWPAFRDALTGWRHEKRLGLRYDDALYRRPEFEWVPSSFACAFVMMCDEMFCDAPSGRYRITEFLDQGLTDFGGFDSIVLWHAYPRIGIDDRNQFDFYRDMPGGLEGLRGLSDACHRRGVRVYIDYNPWDTGTRREGKPDIDVLVDFVRAIDADGIFLDTMERGGADFRRKLDEARTGVVLEGEGALRLENIADHQMSWAQWFHDSAVPGILRNKWFERRHMQHQIHRWNRDHSAELHTAWMNGSGIMVWENVFGAWVGWNPRDRSFLRSMLPIQRRFWRLFCGESWTPLVPTLPPDVFANLWEQDDLRLWTLVNRSERVVEGPLLHVQTGQDRNCFDLMTGRIAGRVEGGQVLLSGTIPPRGILGFVCGTDAALGPDFPQFLARQAGLSRRVETGTAFPTRIARLRPVELTARLATEKRPDGMAAIPAAEFDMTVEFRTRECGFYESQDDALSGPGAHPLHQPHNITRRVALRPYAIDLTPVTNAQYALFLASTRYQPRHTENLLRHWTNGAPPAGKEDHPVVYVDLDDALAYARWAGKRLPTEEEWQYAAQGPGGCKYPWGNDWKDGLCNAGQGGGTTPVHAFPDGRSPFGCLDMCGNVWQWTESERSDGRTRFCILRGGSWYRARGSDWYTDGGPSPCSFAVKFLMTWPGLDRCATIGFRCAVDLS